MSNQSSFTSSFKPFLVKILVPLILVLSIVGYIFGYIFERKVILKSESGGAYKLHRIVTFTDPEETPVFGSSRAETSFIPDTLGSHYFNYGLAGTKTNVALLFMKEDCRKKKNNPYVIVNLDYDGLKNGIGDIANYIPSATDPDIRTLLGKEYKAFFQIPFIKYYGQFENYLRLYSSARVEFTKITNKGASLDKNILTSDDFKKVVQARLNKTEEFYSDTGLRKELFDIINSNPNRFFIFTFSPYHTSFFEHFNRADELNVFIAELKSCSNVKVLDFAKADFNDSLFLNTTHLNYKGAAVFSCMLRDSIAAIKQARKM